MRLLPLPLLVIVACLALLVGACSDSPDPKSKKKAEAAIARSPLTGEEMADGQAGRPILLVKIENTPAGAPQKGVKDADLVVEQLVEGGLTRLAAFYYSKQPKTVGHVRSLRTTDISLAKPVGATIVASGGAGGVVDRVKRNKIGVVTEDQNAAGFRRDPGKSAPYDRLIDTRAIAKRAKSKAKDQSYLPWLTSDKQSLGPEPNQARRATVRFSRGSTTEWKLSGQTWTRANGYSDPEFKADNLVVLEVPVSEAGYTDAAGNPVPETILKGKGKATVLTAEGGYRANWTKKGIAGSIQLTANGEDVRLQPGKTWIELIPRGQGSVSYR